MNANTRKQIYEILKSTNPAPSTELKFASTFELLIAVILSAQATDIAVNRATEKLYLVANTPTALLALGEEKLIKFIQSIGLFRVKAKYILATCEQIMHKHNGQVPNSRNDLEALPGVGRKTANVVLNIAFGQDTIAIDTHIYRVANRTKLAQGKTVRQVEDKLTKLTPLAYRQFAHHWIILHGRYICRARQPECWRCPIINLCEYQNKILKK